MSYTGEASGNSWRGGMRWILCDAQASFCSRACKGAGLSRGGRVARVFNLLHNYFNTKQLCHIMHNNR